MQGIYNYFIFWLSACGENGDTRAYQEYAHD